MFLHADLHSAIFSSAYISCWAPWKLVSFLTTTLILNMELAIWLILKGYFMKRKKKCLLCSLLQNGNIAYWSTAFLATLYCLCACVCCYIHPQRGCRMHVCMHMIDGIVWSLAIRILLPTRLYVWEGSLFHISKQICSVAGWYQ